jgi:predicted nuclease of predicted toxin-antitoxin system
MKILIDECLPISLKNFINFKNKFIVKTVRDMNWIAYNNGKLLKIANDNEFNVIITLDTKMKYQQNLDNFNMIFIFLKVRDNKPETIINYAPLIVETILNIDNKSINKKIIEI